MADDTQAMLDELSFRGLQEGFPRSPLKDVVGDLVKVSKIQRTPKIGNPYSIAIFDLDNIEVIESTMPYILPTAQIEVAHSERKQSMWGVVSRSAVGDTLPDGTQVKRFLSEGQNLKDLLNHRLHFKITAGHMLYDGKAKVEVAKECWEIVGVDGAEMGSYLETLAGMFGGAAPSPQATGPAPSTVGAKPSNAMERAIALADGKTEREWTTTVFTDPVVRADQTVLQGIMNKTFLAEAVRVGLLTVDAGGVYRLVK